MAETFDTLWAWLLSHDLFGEAYVRWVVGLAAGLTGASLLVPVKRFACQQLEKLARHTSTSADDIMLGVLSRRAPLAFLFIVGLSIKIAVDAKPTVESWLSDLLVLLAYLQGAYWLHVLAGASVARWSEQHQSTSSSRTIGAALAFAVRLVIWSAALLLALSSLGVQVTGLLAGLGVGGVAAALAVQSLLGDVMSSVSIYLDRPFDIGDFIIVGDFLGTVERISLRTTRLRSLWGEENTFANSDLTSSRIRNYSRMHERRIHFRFGVTYGSSREALAKVPDAVRSVVEETEHARFARCHFMAFGAYDLVFEVAYYVDTPDYDIYLDCQQAINLGIMAHCEEAGLSFAFPTRTLHVADDHGIGEVAQAATRRDSGFRHAAGQD